MNEEYLGCCCASDPCDVLFDLLETDSPTVSKPMKNTDCCGYWDYTPMAKVAREKLSPEEWK